MAKMFYSLEEAAAKLGKSEAEVKQMAASGQLQEFRDRDRLVFKREQVDLLAGGDDAIPLADELEPISLTSSGSGSSLGVENPKEQTGISIFDADEAEEADPSAQTQITDTALGAGFEIDAGASGSGLLDLTRESDDTSLGADLLEDVLGGQETAAASAVGGEPSALFESTGAEAESAPAAAPIFVAEVIDGPGSGLVGGLALGVVATCAFALAVVLFAMTGASAGLLSAVGNNHWMWVGVCAGVTLVAGVVGLVVGKKM
ncbi:MAG: hypothetical protein M5U20_12525 [Phycisphaerales bacterium]|nr:hypothetical protein [Phycisphaerales bacterium]